MFLQTLDGQVVSPRAEFIRKEVLLFEQLKFVLTLERTAANTPWNAPRVISYALPLLAFYTT